MARKSYTEEFRRQAVDLYRSTPDATLRGIAADLGISRQTLQVWVQTLDPDPASASSLPLSGAAARPGRGAGPTELAALQARVATLETENVKLETERDILRQAAKYFAGEMNW
jgi:transposase